MARLNDEIKAQVDKAFTNQLAAGLVVAVSRTFTWTTPGAFDPDTGSQAEGVAVEAAAMCIPGALSSYEVGQSQGRYLPGDAVLKVRPSDFEETGEPPIGAQVDIGGVPWRYVGKKRVRALGADELVWELVVRR